MSDDLIDLGISIGPLTVSIGSLLRKLLGQKEKWGQTEFVAERFLSLFGAHGVAVSQIQQLLPQVGLDKLNSCKALLGALTNDVLDATASLFGVERTWLDGVSDRLYFPRTCYKHPVVFFDDLAEVIWDAGEFPVRALYSSPTLIAGNGRPQPVVLLLAESIQTLGDEKILRFRVYGDSWDWGYDPARIQLKAMARLIYRILGCPIPLYRVGAAMLERISEGKTVPRSCLTGSPLTDPSLEDYTLSPDESGQAKEVEELPAVLEYIKTMKLEAIAQRMAEEREGRRRRVGD